MSKPRIKSFKRRARRDGDDHRRARQSAVHDQRRQLTMQEIKIAGVALRRRRCHDLLNMVATKRRRVGIGFPPLSLR